MRWVYRSHKHTAIGFPEWSGPGVRQTPHSPTHQSETLSFASHSFICIPSSRGSPPCHSRVRYRHLKSRHPVGEAARLLHLRPLRKALLIPLAEPEGGSGATGAGQPGASLAGWEEVLQSERGLLPADVSERSPDPGLTVGLRLSEGSVSCWTLLSAHWRFQESSLSVWERDNRGTIYTLLHGLGVLRKQ